jgi:hypothetical protein
MNQIEEATEDLSLSNHQKNITRACEAVKTMYSKQIEEYLRTWKDET